MVDFLPEVEVDKDEVVEDRGDLDDKAIANLKAQEEGTQPFIPFEEIDFHPSETKPPPQFMYSAYQEHLRHTMNTYLKRPIKQKFITNSKKCVMTV